MKARESERVTVHSPIPMEKSCIAPGRLVKLDAASEDAQCQSSVKRDEGMVVLQSPCDGERWIE